MSRSRITRIIPDYIVRTFKSGIVNYIDKEDIPKDAAEDSLNWLTEGDSIQLRRGMKVIGTKVSGVGRITGLKTATRMDGKQVLFKSYGRKLKYYNGGDWVEIGTDTLPVEANGEDIAFDDYHSLAGSFLYISSPHSSIYKIPTANPGSIVDLGSTSHRGLFKIKQNRMFLWSRHDTDQVGDPTGLYLSYIDHDELSDYTAVTAENIGTGNGTNKHFTGNLVAPYGTKKTCHYVTITDTVEIFSDDRNGNLLGNKGGTGTINYATGAFDITFNSAPANAQAITADYYWEDSTSKGIADFSYATPRSAGQGSFFRQDDGGGAFQNAGSFADEEFCLHEKKTWRVTLTGDDTNATNLIYRNLVGIPYWRAMTETGEGIPYLDEVGGRDPAVRILSLAGGSSEIIPQSLSSQLDLSDYRFEKAVLFEWNKYLCLACRHKDKSFNDTLFVRNRNWGSWDRLNYFVSVMDNYNGALVAGDSIANNVYELFSGLDDDGAVIDNYWDSKKTDLGIEGLKKVHRMIVEGKIGKDQEIEVWLSLDGSAFSKYYTISGSGSYVAREREAVIGNTTLGKDEIGGGGSGISGAPFEVDFGIFTPAFTDIAIRFKATKIGWAEIQKYVLKDIRYKGHKRIPTQTT